MSNKDGFGAETYYNWWFLDENMQPIPGTKCVNASFRKMDKDSFATEKARAIEILKNIRNIRTRFPDCLR